MISVNQSNVMNVTTLAAPLSTAPIFTQIEGVEEANTLKMLRHKKLKQLWKRNKVRRTLPVYWRRLVEVGVPIQAADILARAIAQYDAARQVPNTKETQLINEYCRFICRAELWRSQLLNHQVA